MTDICYLHTGCMKCIKFLNINFNLVVWKLSRTQLCKFFGKKNGIPFFSYFQGHSVIPDWKDSFKARWNIQWYLINPPRKKRPCRCPFLRPKLNWASLFYIDFWTYKDNREYPTITYKYIWCSDVNMPNENTFRLDILKII